MIKSLKDVRWADLFKVSALAVSITGLVAVLPLVAERADVQDDKAHWRDLAVAYLQSSEEQDLEPVAFKDMAALRIISDEVTGVSVELRGLDDLHTFDSSHLAQAEDIGRESRCLAEALYYEARSEGYSGQVAVAEVILNRVSHRAYPNSICGVVYQGSERSTGCQFTFTCDGSMELGPRGRSWTRAQMIAEHVMMGFAPKMTQSATHYHTTAVNPHWAPSLVRTRQIGTHIFYRFPNRAERRVLREREA